MSDRLRIRVRVEGLPEALDLVNQFRDIDFNDVLDQTGAIYLNRTRERFLKQLRPDGTRWTDSNAALQRARSGRDGGTLFDSGTLFHSISLGKVQNTPTQGSPDNYRSIFTRVPYAAVHQLGLLGQEERQFIGIAVEDRDIFFKAVQKKINDTLVRR